jgi:hypothetical protein
MGRSAGTGSPVFFHCPVWRRSNYKARDSVKDHVITLTGNEKPYPKRRGSALGSRSTKTLREFVCSCGHRGWSNHMDLAYMAGVEPRDF